MKNVESIDTVSILCPVKRTGLLVLLLTQIVKTTT